MRPYFQKHYPSFNHRLFALYPQYNQLTLNQRIEALARTSIQHFHQEYSLKLVALFLAFLTLYLAFSILFTESYWISDQLMTIFLIATIFVLIYVLLKIYGTYQRPQPQKYEIEPVTLFNFKSRFAPKNGAPQNYPTPYSKYNFHYQQEAFEVPSYNRKLVGPHQYLSQQEAIDFRRGKGRVDLGVVKFNPTFKEPPKQKVNLIKTELPELGAGLLPVNYEVEIDKFVKFISDRDLKLKAFEFEGASVFFWMKTELIPEVLNLKMKMDSKSALFMDRLGYRFVWTKITPSNRTEFGLATDRQKVFTVEDALIIRDALSTNNLMGHSSDVERIISDLMDIFEELPSMMRQEFKNQTMKGLNELIVLGRVFQILDFDPALTRPYVYDRLAVLKNTSIQDVKNNSGGKCVSGAWNSNFPTDTQILMHVFSQYVDTEKFQKFSYECDIRKQLYKNYKDLKRGIGGGLNHQSQFMDIIKRFEEKGKLETNAISIYSKSDFTYQPHFELLFQNITYPTLPGVYSAFIAIGWFLKLVKRMNNTYQGVDFTKIIQEILCLENEF